MNGGLLYSGKGWYEPHKRLIGDVVERAQEELEIAFELHEIPPGEPVSVNLVRVQNSKPVGKTLAIGCYKAEFPAIFMYVSRPYIRRAEQNNDIELRKTYFHEMGHAAHDQMVGYSSSRLLDRLVIEGVAYVLESTLDESDETERYFTIWNEEPEKLIDQALSDALGSSTKSEQEQRVLVNDWFFSSTLPNPGNVAGFFLISQLINNGHSLGSIMSQPATKVVEML